MAPAKRRRVEPIEAIQITDSETEGEAAETLRDADGDLCEATGQDPDAEDPHDAPPPEWLAAEEIDKDPPVVNEPPNSVETLPADSQPAAAPVAVQPPVEFQTQVHNERHRTLCSVLLPVVLEVMRSVEYRHAMPRDQVREACKRVLVFRV